MKDLTGLHNALIGWFRANRADLPWRRTRDPYAIWIAEVMLQQTQVATVIPYYERFLTRFPTVEALAAAPLDEVLKLWEGLGYYSRARNLHRAARMIVKQFGGKLPSTVNDLLRLPGVGRYTAGAVASLAFGRDVPLLDGNVIRVLSRLLNIENDVMESATRRALWEQAERLLPPERAALWNEGLMELGQQLCTPATPSCPRCPIAGWCEAYRLGLQGERPVRSRRRKKPHYDVTAGVIRGQDGRLLIARRPPDGMLGGLWEFPGGKRQPDESLVACLKREIREELGIEIAVEGPVTTVRHAYTHFRITLHAFYCRHIGGEPQAIECAGWAWATLEELDQYAFPVTDRKIIAVLRGGSGQPERGPEP